jgi:hypothetical protein
MRGLPLLAPDAEDCCKRREAGSSVDGARDLSWRDEAVVLRADARNDSLALAAPENEEPNAVEAARRGFFL